MDRLKYVLPLLFLITGIHTQSLSASTVLTQHIKLDTGTKGAYLLPVHSWKEHEQRKPKGGRIGPAEGQKRFKRNGGGWSDFKHRHRKGIRRYKRNVTPRGRPDKGAYYFYNYRYGYLTDNCEFIRGPKKFCWYNAEGARKCRWKLKWQYSCY